MKLRRARLEPVQQMEAAECGVACLSMLLGFHGHHVPLSEVRRICGTSRDGNTAAELLRGAAQFGLKGRGLSVRLERLRSARAPAILHWDMNHFVVLESSNASGIVLVDPASGRRSVSWEEADRLFSGVLLEIDKGPEFLARKATSASYRRYVSALSRCKDSLAFVLVANGVGQTLALAFPAASQVLIDQVILPGRREWLVPVLGVMLLSGIGQVTLIKLQGASQAHLQGALSIDFSTELGRKILFLPLPFVESRGHGDLLGRVHLQSELQGLVARTAQGLFDAFAVLLFGALMLAYDVRLGALIFLLVTLRLTVIRQVRSATAQRVAIEIAARAREQSAVVEATSCPEMIKGLALEPHLLDRYARNVVARVRASVSAQRLQRLIGTGLTVLSGLMEAVILWYGGSRVIDGRMSVGVFAGFLAIQALVQAPLASLLGLLESWLLFRAALTRTDEILAVPDCQLGNVRRAPNESRFELRNVGFRYGSGGRWVLRGVSLVIEPGQHVALIGPSGHGKSTLVNLLCGLLEPSEGEVLLDGVPVTDYERATLSRDLGVVLQEPLILEGTLREALALRMPDAPDSELQRGALLACFADVMNRLPGGMAAHVAAQGSNLSGGERQRLALAQALVGGPRLLVLDEATCALDPETEQRVLTTLDRLPATIVSAAHRADVVARAERVFLVREGTVQELDPSTFGNPALWDAGGTLQNRYVMPEARP